MFCFVVANCGQELGGLPNIVLSLSRNLVRGEGALVIELASGASAAEAAQRSGISERSVYRRLADEQFKLKVYQAREMMIAQACGTLAMTGAKAAATLNELLDNENPHIRLRAAQAILSNTVSFSDHWGVDFRIARLEGLMTPLSANRKTRKG